IDARRAGAIGLVAGDAGMSIDRLPCLHAGVWRWQDRLFRRTWWQALEINGDGVKISVAHLGGRVDDDFGHRPVGVAPGVAAAGEIFGDVVDAPGFQAAARGRVKPRREPAADHVAGEGAAALVGAEQVLRRMTCATMTEPLD